MRLAGFDPGLEPGMRELARALGRLEEDQGRVARRNARAAVAKALRKIREKVDKNWAPARKTLRRRKALLPEQRAKQLAKGGWGNVSETSAIARMLASGIKPQTITYLDGFTQIMVPGWVLEIWKYNPHKLRRAKRDLTYRRALLTELALKDVS